MPKTDGAARWKAMNEPLIEQFRAAGGKLRRRNPVLLLTTTGARTGRSITVPLNFTLDGDRLIVIASAGGSARHPAWYRNLRAIPEVVIEHDGQTFTARAHVVEEPERTRLYDRHVAAMPFFDGYRRRVKAREIPVVAFEKIGG
jgi:deazaflavin-dependent oxidoreductase (nitroreductase family)